MQLNLVTRNEVGVDKGTRDAISKIESDRELIHIETQLQITAEVFAKKGGVCTTCRRVIASPADATYIEVPNYGSRFGGTTRHLVHSAPECRNTALAEIVRVSLLFASRVR